MERGFDEIVSDMVAEAKRGAADKDAPEFRGAFEAVAEILDEALAETDDKDRWFLASEALRELPGIFDVPPFGDARAAVGEINELAHELGIY